MYIYINVHSSICHKAKGGKTMFKCSNPKCTTKIDKTACGERFSILTIKDDRTGKNETKRLYFCSLCTMKINAAIFDDSIIL